MVLGSTVALAGMGVVAAAPDEGAAPAIERAAVVRARRVPRAAAAAELVVDTAAEAPTAWRDAVPAAESILAEGHDFVVFGAASGPVLPRGSGDGGRRTAEADGGYSLLDPQGFQRDRYVIRLVPSSGVEQLRPYLVQAAAAASDPAPASVAVGSAPGDMAPGAGEIDVKVSTSSPCSGAWVACGGPTMNGHEIRSGRIWIHPRLLTRSSHDIANTVHHELGHALGLGHFDAAYNGVIQVMHSRQFTAASYEAGDRNGLASMATRSATPTLAVAGIGYEAGRMVMAADVARRGAASAVLSLVVDGAVVASQPVGDGRWTLAGPAGGGAHTVCARVEFPGGRLPDQCYPFTAPANPFGYLDAAEAISGGIRVRGWTADPQTAEPISVSIVIDGIGLQTRADRPRPDVARVFPAYGPNHGYETSRPALPGRHQVCAVARNVDAGTDTTLGCATVEVASVGVNSLGA